MAVEPLFNADRETLLKRARIETADDEQTIALIDQTITEVRLGFYRSVGKDRANTIAGYSLVDNPSSDEEILKAGAATTEANWLTWLLAQRLPHMFLDNRASTDDMWNEEQLTRDTQVQEQYLKALKAQIDAGLGDLQEPVSETSGPAKASSIQADSPATPYASGTFRGLYPHGTNIR